MMTRTACCVPKSNWGSNKDKEIAEDYGKIGPFCSGECKITNSPTGLGKYIIGKTYLFPIDSSYVKLFSLINQLKLFEIY